MNRFPYLFTGLLLIAVALILFPLAAAAGTADFSQALLALTDDGNGVLLAPLASIAIFDFRSLTAAVNKMRPVKTPVLDKVFKRKKRKLSSLFSWDIKSSAERILKNILVGAPAQVTDKVGRKTITCASPRFSEKRPISPEDLDGARACGEESAPALIMSLVADEQFDMKTDMDRTREFMAVKAITGQVVDEEGTVIVDYNFPAAQKPVLAGVALWTDPDGKPINNLRAWKKYISQRVSVDRFIAFCGCDAMDALIDNPQALEKLKYAAGKQIADEGRISFLAGVEIEEYFGAYKDAAGDIQQMIGDDEFILVGIGPDVAAELFAPVADLKAGGGVGKGKPADIFFSKSWETEDPSVRWVKVESRPLPVLFQPEAIIYAKVV